MTLYDRYLSRQILRVLGQTTLALLGLFVLVDLLSVRLERIDRFETPLAQAALYYLYMIPGMLFEYHLLAISILVAGLMVLGRAAQNNEVTTMLAAGVSLRRLAVAPLALGLVLAMGALAFHETIGVRMTARQRQIDMQYMRRADAVALTTVSWPHLPGGWTCHVLVFNPVALTGEDVFIHRNEPGMLEEIRARRIYWSPEERQWMLEDGRRFSTNTNEDWRQQVQRITSAPAPFDTPPEQLFALEEPSATRSIWALHAAMEQAAAYGIPTQRAWLDFHRKLAQPVLCAVMMLLAIPFAVRLRRGGMAAGFGLSIGIALAYMLVFYGGAGLAYINIVPPAIGAWMANAVFGVAGVVLLARTPS